MNFLQLAQRAYAESGLQGPGPSAVASQTGFEQKFLDWTWQAWSEIQRMRDWSFMQQTATPTLIAGTRTYSLTDLGLSDFKRWDENGIPLIKLTAADQGKLTWYEYQDFRPRFEIGDPTSARPRIFTMTPARVLKFDSTPDQAYICELPYWKTAQIFSTDSETPTGLDVTDFHMIIVWKTLEHYGIFDNAADVLQRARVNFPQVLEQMEEVYLPKTRFVPSPLA